MYQTKNPQDFVFYGILLFFIGWVAYTFRALFAPLIIAGLIAYLLNPFVNRLSTYNWISRTRLVPVVYLVFLGLFVWGTIYLTPLIASQASQLEQQLTQLPEQFETLQTTISNTFGIQLPLNALAEDLEKDIGQMIEPRRVFRMIQGASANLVWVVVTIITSFHLLRDWAKLREWFFDLVPQEYEPDVRRLHQEIKAIWQTYLRGQFVIMLILGFLSGLSAALVGLPGALSTE